LFTLDVKFDLIKIEDIVKKFWKDNQIPKKWREQHSDKWFKFLEGPPTVNGLPHAGHIRGRTYKDVVLRFYRLMGYNVWAQGGWDEHGLPVELEVEKKLGLRSKKDIEKIGFDKFSMECNELVNYYLKIWQEDGTEKLALWLDLDNAYETRRPYYVEHVWAFLKEMWERGLLFEDYRVLPFCPRCETALSDAEVDQGYEDREDPSIFVKFPLIDEENTYLVIWTTTPWTLIDNEAVAVNARFRYAKVEVELDGKIEYWILAEDLVNILMGKFGIKNFKIVQVMYGEDLKGRRYRHPFIDEVNIHKEHDDKAHYVVTADFVTLEMGTGLVHIAPAHGPEDFDIARQYGIPITNLVHINGVFDEKAGIFGNKSWIEVSKMVLEKLKEKNLLIHEETIIHSYPHCWRCGTPLLYLANRQWFLKVSTIRDRMVEELRKVKIYPENLRDRFENWVQNAKDWTISRSRVWGTPLPIWRCREDPEKILIIGSLEELKKVAKKLPNVTDELLIHRPWIDMIEIETSDCKEWIREPYVVDVWLDSGLAWIASINGMKEKDLWIKLYPFTWVTEGIDQTRGWFYTLLTTSVLWFNKAPYESILIQGHVVDKYGQKMSKSKGNVVWAKDLYAKWGADATRLYILYKSSPWDLMHFDPDEIGEIRRVLSILWNVVKFADTYMKLDKFDPKKHKLQDLIVKALPEDLWLLSRFNLRLREIINHMFRYELHLATREWINLVVEDLSHSYIRLIRRRVWTEEEKEDKYAAYAVLYDVLKKTIIVGSMFVPHITEYLWQAFIRNYEANEVSSVHLTRMPEVIEEFIDENLERTFNIIFKIFSETANARSKASIKLRWPLRKLYVELISNKELKEYLTKLKYIIEYLTNVKEVEITLERPEIELKDYEVVETSDFKIYLYKVIDERLLYEALAREIVRRIQFMRAKMNLRVDEKIRVYIDTQDRELIDAVREFKEYIMTETRALEIHVATIPEGSFAMDWEIEGKKVRLGIQQSSLS